MQISSNISAFKLTKKCFNEEGVLGFFKGVISPLISFSIINGFNLTFNEMSKKALGSADDSSMSIKTGFISGLIAGVGISIIHTPIDLIKVRLQIQTNETNTQYKSIRHLVYLIHKNEGIKGLYLGGAITFLKEAVTNSIYFGVYHSVKKTLCRIKKIKYEDLRSREIAIAGALSGGISVLLTYPLEICKTLIQTGRILDTNSKELNKTIFMDNLHSTNNHILYKYKPIFFDGGILNCLRHINSSKGIFFFYRAINLTIIQTMLENGFMFVIFEKMKKELTNSLM